MDMPPLHMAITAAAKLATVGIVKIWNKRSEHTERRDNKTLSKCSHLLEFPTDKASLKFIFERDFEDLGESLPVKQLQMSL